MPDSILLSKADRFQILALLGEGATGSVYRVHDGELGCEVALKTLRLPGPEALYRLKHEFRTRAGLSHPNLLQLYELFVEGESCFLTMELLEGRDFLHWARHELALRGGAAPTQETSLASQVTSEPMSPPRLDRPLPSKVPAQAVETPFAAASGPPPGWKELRDGLAQLLQGLQTLHAADLVHRDIKPENVLVTRQGRVVLLDFGLAMTLDNPSWSRGRRAHGGTPAYMAPEQVLGRPLTPAADLYGVGAMLYEVLTGGWPFAGDPLFLELKARQMPPPVNERAPNVPSDLADLAAALLKVEPTRRPGIAECLSRLVSTAAGPAAPARVGPLFIGRERELAVLADCLTEVVRRERGRAIHIHGPSGMGKSTLVRQFLERERQACDPLVFQGRCHPQESVPYKALDAAIDSLARHLESLPVDAAAALMPVRAYALARLFPVLGRLAAFRRIPEPPVLPDPAELRQQGALALRELLERLARGSRPVVLWIDDAQWGDTESAPLFEVLLQAPAPPVLLVLTYRSEDLERGPLIRLLRELAPPEAGPESTARELALAALPEAAVGALASALLGLGKDGDRVRAVVAQAEGNPFIACELARYVGTHAATPLIRVDVAQLVVERIQALPAEQRALLEVASLAGRPLARGIALRAAGVGEGGRPLVASLRDSGLLREVPGEEEPGIAAYHDRIREALLGALPYPDRVLRHRAVAEALTERGSEDYDALLLYWEGAGEPVRAGRCAVLSADRAARALAFETAAIHYQKGLELLGEEADRSSLLERFAGALANLGRAEEAARRYLEAAGILGDAVELERVRDLKRRAAEQYLKSGRFDEGWRELEVVLRALKVPIPGSFLSAAWAATWRRLVFLARRLELDAPVPVPAASSAERHRMEVLWTSSTSWVMVNPMLSDAFRTMHLLRASQLGDAATLRRAVTMEATMQFHLGGWLMGRSAQQLLDRVRQGVERSGEPYDQAWYALALVCRGYTRGRWREVVEAGERAEVIFREQCPGSDWERVTLAIFHHHALAMLGELRSLSARLSAFDRDAVQRGDLHARGEAWMGEPVVVWLAQDRVVEARSRAEEALAAQSPRTSAWPENAYRRQQFAQLIATVYTAHYRGDPWPAWQAVAEDWGPLRSSLMLSLRTTGLNLRHMRARAGLAAAAALADVRALPPEPVAPRWRRPALLADVRAQVRVIRRDPLGCAPPIRGLIEAGLAWLEEDAPLAQQWLEEAVEGFRREEMALYREAARYALGAVRGGAPGQALQRQAREWMEAQGVVRPGALTSALVPGVTAWQEALSAQSR